jgi:ribosomal protein S25
MQAPKPQVSKEAKALAASNSSKGKKKVSSSTTAFSITCYIFIVSQSPCGLALEQPFCAGQHSDSISSPQKWSKGKMKEKVNNQVLFDQVGHLPSLPFPGCMKQCTEMYGAAGAVNQVTNSDEHVVSICESGIAGSMSLSLTWCLKGPSAFATAKGVLYCLQPTYDKLLAEVPKYKLITQSVLSDRLRVSNLHADMLQCLASYITQPCCTTFRPLRLPQTGGIMPVLSV